MKLSDGPTTRRTKPIFGRKTLYIAAAVAMVAMSGGFALAAVLTVTPVSQTANFYQGGSTGVPGYSAPALMVSLVPVATTTCSSGTTAGATSGGTTTLILSSTSGGTVCTALNFAEEFTLSFSATISNQINKFTITTQVGALAVQTNSASINLGAGGAPAAFTQTVLVYVDYGAITPPAAGITVLDLVVS